MGGLKKSVDELNDKFVEVKLPEPEKTYFNFRDLILKKYLNKEFQQIVKDLKFNEVEAAKLRDDLESDKILLFTPQLILTNCQLIDNLPKELKREENKSAFETVYDFFKIVAYCKLDDTFTYDIHKKPFITNFVTEFKKDGLITCVIRLGKTAITGFCTGIELRKIREKAALIFIHNYNNSEFPDKEMNFHKCPICFDGDHPFEQCLFFSS